MLAGLRKIDDRWIFLLFAIEGVLCRLAPVAMLVFVCLLLSLFGWFVVEMISRHENAFG
jgi:hypothetical protein